MWTLIYIVTVMSSWASIGMMVEGPFKTEQSCLEYASETWSENKGWKEPTDSMISDGRNKNFYNSSYTIYYVDNDKGNVGTYYSCVKPREIK